MIHCTFFGDLLCTLTQNNILALKSLRQIVIRVFTKVLGACKVPRKLDNLTDKTLKRHLLMVFQSIPSQQHFFSPSSKVKEDTGFHGPAQAFKS